MNAREQWLADRRKGIGGSDIGAILGLSPYRTLMDVFLDKRGETQPKGNEQAMYWGTVLEDVVAHEYQKRTDRKIQRVNQMLAHPSTTSCSPTSTAPSSCPRSPVTSAGKTAA